MGPHSGQTTDRLELPQSDGRIIEALRGLEGCFQRRRRELADER